METGNHQSFSQFEDQHPVALGVLLVGTHLSNLECNNQSHSVFLSCHSCQVAVCVVFCLFFLFYLGDKGWFEHQEIHWVLQS